MSYLLKILKEKRSLKAFYYTLKWQLSKNKKKQRRCPHCGAQSWQGYNEYYSACGPDDVSWQIDCKRCGYWDED